MQWRMKIFAVSLEVRVQDSLEAFLHDACFSLFCMKRTLVDGCSV